MEKAILFICLGTSFIFFPSFSLLISSIMKRETTICENIFISTLCLLGCIFVMAAIFVMGSFIR